jgi:hypothetical protein
MSDENVVPEVVAGNPVSEPEATAAPEPVEAVAETAKPVDDKPNVFTQEELDKVIDRRLKKARRSWEREQQALKATPSQAEAAALPSRDEDPDAYAEALAERKATELLARREAEREQMALLEAYHDREEAARDRYDDFEQVAYNNALPITTVMAQTIQASELGPDIAYHLGSNPREAERISRLSPYLQAKEIGKIEAKLADSPAPVKKTTSAPPPIKPVTAKGAGTPVYDTTDPRSISAMSASEWIERERQRQIKQWEARRNR